MPDAEHQGGLRDRYRRSVIAGDAGVAQLVYYPIVTPPILPGTGAAWLESVDDVFEYYSMSQDGTAFTLPPDAKGIIQTAAQMPGLLPQEQ